MAESESEQRGVKRFMLPAIVAGLITLVLGLFVIGYTSLTEPDPPRRYSQPGGKSQARRKRQGRR